MFVLFTGLLEEPGGKAVVVMVEAPGHHRHVEVFGLIVRPVGQSCQQDTRVHAHLHAPARHALQGLIQGTTPTTFANLTFSGTGTKSYSLNTTITGTLSIASGTVVNLGTGLTHTSLTLKLNNLYQVTGSWGGTGSGATNINTTYFAATSGILNNNPGCTAGTWLGTTGTDWNDATNWCGGIPASSTDVVIPSGLTNYPVIDPISETRYRSR